MPFDPASAHECSFSHYIPLQAIRSIGASNVVLANMASQLGFDPRTFWLPLGFFDVKTHGDRVEAGAGMVYMSGGSQVQVIKNLFDDLSGEVIEVCLVQRHPKRELS